MLKTSVIGFLAGFGTTFASLPDLVAMLRRRSTQGMNPRMAAIMAAFQMLWVWYGALIGSVTVIGWNLVAMATNFATVAAYLHFRSGAAHEPGEPRFDADRSERIEVSYSQRVE